MKRFEKRFAILVLTAAALAGMACSFSLPGGGAAPTAGAGASPTAEPGGAGRATQFPATLPTQASGGLKAPAPTQAAGGQKALALPSVGANLGNLDSYRMSFAMTIKGTDQNQKPTIKTLTMLQEVLKSQNQSHLQMTGISLAGASDNGALDIYQIDKQSYLYSKSGDNRAAPTCLSFSSGKQTINENALLKSEALLKDIQAQELIASGETVNGVNTDHYKVSQASLGIGKSTDAGGDLWAAQDGGYAVKFTGTATGSFNISKDTIDGTLTWVYNLANINSLKAIQLPPECQTQQEAVGDLPVPPNASDIANLGTLITLSSPDQPGRVADFYRAQLPGKGWMITKDSSLGADLITLEIGKGPRNMTILITSDSNSKGTSVLITSK